MRRVADVLDVWFDSGSMSFAQVHYPFENADWFRHRPGHFPGDFIVEYIGQTRGWFYTLHVLATAIFDRPAFEACISHGIVLGSDGNKMSKSLRNYPDVREVFDRDGADAMRWFLMSQPDPARRQPGRHRAGHPRLGAPGADPAVEHLVVLQPLRQRRRPRRQSALDDLDRPAGPLPAGQDPPVRRGDDRARSTTTPSPRPATRPGRFLDVLTNWYIRRSRERFWDEDAARPSTRCTPCSRSSAGPPRRCCR